MLCLVTLMRHSPVPPKVFVLVLLPVLKSERFFFSSFHLRASSPLWRIKATRVVNLSVVCQAIQQQASQQPPPLLHIHSSILPPTTSLVSCHSSLFRLTAAQPMGCWRPTKGRGRCYDLRSGLIDNHKQSSGLVRGHHTCAIKTSDGASRERKGWRVRGEAEGGGGQQVWGMMEGVDVIGFTYERVNYRNECVNTYSLKGIWRHREGSRRQRLVDNEFTMSSLWLLSTTVVTTQPGCLLLSK